MAVLQNDYIYIYGCPSKINFYHSSFDIYINDLVADNMSLYSVVGDPLDASETLNGLSLKYSLSRGYIQCVVNECT
jgi:hypothetical protein